MEKNVFQILYTLGPHCKVNIALCCLLRSPAISQQSRPTVKLKISLWARGWCWPISFTWTSRSLMWPVRWWWLRAIPGWRGPLWPGCWWVMKVYQMVWPPRARKLILDFYVYLSNWVPCWPGNWSRLGSTVLWKETQREVRQHWFIYSYISAYIQALYMYCPGCWEYIR
jgi:hypothetical protein